MAVPNSEWRHWVGVITGVRSVLRFRGSQRQHHQSSPRSRQMKPCRSHQMRGIGLRGWWALVLHPTALLYFHLSLRGEENGRACKKESLTLKKALLETCFKSEQKGFYLLFGVREEMIYTLKGEKFWWIWRNLNRQSAPLVLAGWKSIRLQYSETKRVFPICISHIHITTVYLYKPIILPRWQTECTTKCHRKLNVCRFARHKNTCKINNKCNTCTCNM